MPWRDEDGELRWGDDPNDGHRLDDYQKAWAALEREREFDRFPTLDEWLTALWERRIPAVTRRAPAEPFAGDLLEGEARERWLTERRRIKRSPRGCRTCSRTFPWDRSYPDVVHCPRCRAKRLAAAQRKRAERTERWEAVRTP
jgi:DNA-directed RNA polymerase subunit RPC12/RpoP